MLATRPGPVRVLHVAPIALALALVLHLVSATEALAYPPDPLVALDGRVTSRGADRAGRVG